MTLQSFDFDTEFALLDVGATGEFITRGGLRPGVLAYRADGAVQALTLDVEPGASPAPAVDGARRFLRDGDHAAYAFVGELTRVKEAYHVAAEVDQRSRGSNYLGVALCSRGRWRTLLYPIRLAGDRMSLASPLEGSTPPEWCPIGDIWANPFVADDLVRFAPPNRAVPPGTPLWQTIVDLTKLRIVADPANAQDYQVFLDDLRTGVFLVAGRSPDDLNRVILKPRTVFNPIGSLEAPAAKLLLVSASVQSGPEGRIA